MIGGEIGIGVRLKAAERGERMSVGRVAAARAVDANDDCISGAIVDDALRTLCERRRTSEQQTLSIEPGDVGYRREVDRTRRIDEDACREAGQPKPLIP